MLCDAHIHVGYYSRLGEDEPFYYSPRRIAGTLNRCGIDEFVVSSTCAQVAGIGIRDIVREAREIKRIVGDRSHVFFWLSGHLYDEDPQMHWLDSGLFSGFKFHEEDTPWFRERHRDLLLALSVAEERNMPVMFHSGENDGSRPKELARIADKFPSIRFCFAHCRPMDEMSKVVKDYPNVWTDTAYMALDEFSRLRNYDWHGRLMFGTDLPVWQAYENVGLCKQYRIYIKAMKASGLADESAYAFRNFLTKGRDKRMNNKIVAVVDLKKITDAAVSKLKVQHIFCAVEGDKVVCRKPGEEISMRCFESEVNMLFQELKAVIGAEFKVTGNGRLCPYHEDDGSMVICILPKADTVAHVAPNQNLGLR